MFQWAAGDPKGLPFDPPAILGAATLRVAGVDLDVTRPVQFRFADAVRGAAGKSRRHDELRAVHLGRIAARQL